MEGRLGTHWVYDRNPRLAIYLESAKATIWISSLAALRPAIFKQAARYAGLCVLSRVMVVILLDNLRY